MIHIKHTSSIVLGVLAALAPLYVSCAGTDDGDPTAPLTSSAPGATSAPPGVTSAPPVMSSAPPVMSSTPPAMSSTPPAMSSAPPAMSSAPPVATCDALPILTAKCGTCHPGIAGSNLKTLATMLDVDAPTSAAGGAPCAGQGKIINTANPAESLLLNKLTAAPKCGTSMTAFASPALTPTELTCITDFVNSAGAM
jgi:hypothetical protein